jgi:hypothetical protein
VSTAGAPQPAIVAGDVSKPGLIVYCFAPSGLKDREEARRLAAYLGRRWRACFELGIGEPIEGYPAPPEALETYLVGELRRPLAVIEPTAEILAAAERPDEVEAYQAFLFRIQDALGLVAQLAPNVERDSLARWDDLGGEWSDALSAARAADGPPEQPAELLGEAMVYTALFPARPDPAALRTQIASVLGGTGSLDLVDPDITLWEAARAPARDRLLAAVAPKAREDDLDALVWWDPASGVGLAPLVRYLLNAAKLRFELNVLTASIPELRAAKQEVEERIDGLLAVRERLPDRGTVRIDSMLAAQVELTAAQTGAAGLVNAVTRLRELRQTARIAAQNMAASLRGRVPAEAASGDGPLARDAAIEAWVEDQVEHELAYLQAVKDRADEAHRLAALRLQHTADARARLQNQLTLFQASLVGGLLAAMGAIQALDPDLRLARHLDMPLAVFLGALVFALPLMVVNWFEPYDALDYLAVGIFGAAAGWLILRRALGEEALGWQVVAAVAGLSVAASILAAIDAAVARRAPR